MPEFSHNLCNINTMFGGYYIKYTHLEWLLYMCRQTFKLNRMKAVTKLFSMQKQELC